MPTFLPAAAAFFESDVGEAVAAGAASSAVGAGLNAALAKKPSINIPPPPGAAMVDSAGAAAAAQQRQRAAAAGGLPSTITGAGNAPGATPTGGPTSGAKQLQGQ